MKGNHVNQHIYQIVKKTTKSKISLWLEVRFIHQIVLSALAISCLHIPLTVSAEIKIHNQEQPDHLKTKQESKKDRVLLEGELFLQPGIAFEGYFSQFHLFPSSAYLSLTKSNYSAHILFAEDRPFLKNIFPGYPPQKDYGLQSIFIQTSYYGRMRIGLIPLSYGLEGGVRDSQMLLPRSLFFSLIPHYDLGLSYFISHRGFYVESAVHNGYFQKHNLPNLQSDTLWWRARGGWKGDYGIDIGLSAIIGKSHFTQDHQFYNNYALQLGNIYMSFEIPQFLIDAEFHFGELFINQNKTFISSWHIDLEHPFIGSSSLFARWDQIYIDKQITAIPSQQTITLGAFIKHKQSIFSIFYENPFTLTQWDQPRLIFVYRLLLEKTK